MKRGVGLIKIISDATDHVSESVITEKRERLSANGSAIVWVIIVAKAKLTG